MTRIGIALTGWDGSTWDLSSGSVRLMPGGLDGLVNMLEPEDKVRTGAQLDGQTYEGWRANPRTGLLPVLIGQASLTVTQFMAVDAAWWKVWRPGKVNTLQVTAPGGTVRTLGLRFQSDGLTYPNDPTKNRVYPAPMKVVADDPWWRGADIGGTFSNGAGYRFFGGTNATHKGPPFYISSANTVARPILSNPGDADVWPTYTIKGPVSSFTSTLGAATLLSTISVATGQQLVIYTDPLLQVAYLIAADGTQTNVTRDLDSWAFAKVDAGASVSLDLALVGTGAVVVAGKTRYLKAW